MPPRLPTRREFLHESVVACPATAAVPLADRPPTAADDYEVLFLGDVHFDRLAHHDMQWLEREKPNDVAQVQNYSRLTREVWPLTLGRLRASVAAARGTVAPVAFVAQAGDFVEGLCMLSGRGAYSPEQVTVEPEFGRDTEADRRGVVVAEAPYIRAFEYGDVPGYARISIGEAVRTHLHAGLAAESWRTLDLSALRDRAAPARGASGRRPLHLEHSERSWRLA